MYPGLREPLAKISHAARADFPGGNAGELWHSIQRILSLPDETHLFTGHDYRPNGRSAAWESTVAEQRASNVHLRQATDEAAFVEFRQKRDRKSACPKHILHALQVDIQGGRLPKKNGKRYLKIPLDVLK